MEEKSGREDMGMETVKNVGEECVGCSSRVGGCSWESPCTMIVSRFFLSQNQQDSRQLEIKNCVSLNLPIRAKILTGHLKMVAHLLNE